MMSEVAVLTTTMLNFRFTSISLEIGHRVAAAENICYFVCVSFRWAAESFSSPYVLAAALLCAWPLFRAAGLPPYEYPLPFFAFAAKKRRGLTCSEGVLHSFMPKLRGGISASGLLCRRI